MFDVNSFSQGVYIDAIFYCCKRFKGLNKTFFQKKNVFFSWPYCVVCEVEHLKRHILGKQGICFASGQKSLVFVLILVSIPMTFALSAQKYTLTHNTCLYTHTYGSHKMYTSMVEIQVGKTILQCSPRTQCLCQPVSSSLFPLIPLHPTAAPEIRPKPSRDFYVSYTFSSFFLLPSPVSCPSSKLWGYDFMQ